MHAFWGQGPTYGSILEPGPKTGSLFPPWVTPRGVGWWGWCRGVGRREEPAAAAGGVRGDSPVALGVPSARGRAAGGSRGRLMHDASRKLPKMAKKTATVTLSLHMGGWGREAKAYTIVNGITSTTTPVLLPVYS